MGYARRRRALRTYLHRAGRLRGIQRVVLSLKRFRAVVAQVIFAVGFLNSCPALPEAADGDVQINGCGPIGCIIISQHLNRQGAAASQQLPAAGVIDSCNQPAWKKAAEVSRLMCLQTLLCLLQLETIMSFEALPFALHVLADQLCSGPKDFQRLQHYFAASCSQQQCLPEALAAHMSAGFIN